MLVDSFPLTQSEQFKINSREEIRVDLVLKNKSKHWSTRLSGKVRMMASDISDTATVQILDNDLNPVAHSITDEEGIYEFDSCLEPGEYKLVAAAKGYCTSRVYSFSLSEDRSRVINVPLRKISSLDYTVIYGRVIDALTKVPIPNVNMELIHISGRIYAFTESNDHGQYLFNSIEPGRYKIRTNTDGYFELLTYIEVIRGTVVKSDAQLFRNLKTFTSTLSGIIKDGDEACTEAFVGLYQIEGEDETLIQSSITNDRGLYLFTGVNPGSYMIKAKLKNGTEYSKKENVYRSV